MKNEVIDCTEFGDIFELNPEGHLDTTENIEDLFCYLVEEGKYDLPARTKLKVLGSNVDWSNRQNPFRYSKEIVRTLGYIKRYYLSWNHVKEEFDIDKYREHREFRFADMEKEGERRAAFGLMRMIGDANRTSQLVEDHQKAIKAADGDERKIKKLEKELEQKVGGQMLIIG